MNQPPSTNPSPSPYNNARLTAPSSGECGNCGSQKRWVLHHVRIRGIHRRLCTSCVLRLHPSSFCPTCFQFYDSNNNVPPSSKRLTCSKCSSFTHSHCAPTNQPPSSSAYLCPPCASPNFVFFDIGSDPNRAIDKRLALILLCAAKISAASMNKAVILARGEAERRVREAALARKRAREALDNLAVLVSGRGDKAVRKDAAEGSAEVSRSGNVGSRQKEKSPLGQQNSQGKMFNGFSGHPRQSSMVSPLGKNDNGSGEHKPVIDHHHRPGLQSNGNLYEKDKSGAMDEKVKLEPKI
ncbi:Zinc finger, FYVE/PHD-type [Parasponia andersonii]|uniref:Zinc finger, FYVE/PHD-type n=1 Tax=Parasponia andersonii TaxID=3476 RepID=A0A2P5D8F8_PARAD|nr:Zinc finger, FYVE/PHD-type [Parasponia andersonii]